MTIYIAGPYAADPERYTRECQSIAARYIAAGHTVICPHVTSAGIESAVPESRWREHGLELLVLCDTIVMHPDWEQSEGARCELRVAREMGLVVVMGERP